VNQTRVHDCVLTTVTASLASVTPASQVTTHTFVSQIVVNLSTLIINTRLQTAVSRCGCSQLSEKVMASRARCDPEHGSGASDSECR